MNLNKILIETDNFTKVVTSMKEISPIYPAIRSSYSLNTNTVYLTTMARIQRDGKWYLVHCMENFTPTTGHKVQAMEIGYHRLIRTVHNVHYLYKVGTHMEDLDPDQTPEPERLRKLMYPFK